MMSKSSLQYHLYVTNTEQFEHSALFNVSSPWQRNNSCCLSLAAFHINRQSYNFRRFIARILWWRYPQTKQKLLASFGCCKRETQSGNDELVVRLVARSTLDRAI